MIDAVRNKIRKISSSQFIILGFLLVILLGSLVLMLPLSTADGRGASFFDALFTATSAVCVTGLIVKDTATYWSAFGQSVILILIQIGGMGVITVAIAFMTFSGGKIGLMQRSTMQEAIAAPHVGGIIKLVKSILVGVLLIEFIGAVLFSFVFVRDFGVGRGLWYAVFHSVSAFCNAGFDLMGVREPFSSFTSYRGNVLINVTTILLIIVGGLGFLTWEDIRTNKFYIKKYKMQTKVILTVTSILLLLPGFYFFFAEIREGSLLSRILQAAFQSTTARTAGFNTVDLASLSEVGLLLFILLMLVGGSPGSTAGGMKTTTIAVLFASAFSVFKRDEHVQFFGRRLPEDTLSHASTILILYLGLFLSGGMVISAVDGIPLLTALFETGSAIGTVGVTLGVTTKLGTLSRLIIIGLMFFGRVGGLTLIYATLKEKRKTGSKYPQEKLTVG